MAMNSLNEISCLVCGSKDYDIVCSYAKPDQYEVAVGIKEEGYFRKWVRCRNCGFYYSIFSRSKDALETIYTSDYRGKNSKWRGASAETTFQRVISLPDGESEAKYRIKWIKEHIGNIWESGLLRQKESPYHMLDIGGSPGVFAYEFQDDKWKSYLIDPDENAGFIKKRYNIPFLQKKYEPNSFGVSFDLVCAIFVLEHLTNPIDFLMGIQNDMDADSLLYLEVPDAICFELKPPEDDIFNSCHLWMFSPQTLVMLLAQSGFEVYSLYRTKTVRGHYTLMVLAGKDVIVKEACI